MPLHADHHARDALKEVEHYLDRCKLSTNTIAAYRRQATAYVDWVSQDGTEHQDAFTDVIGAEAAVTAWRRVLCATEPAPPR